MKSILMSHMMVINNPKTVHKICYELILMTFIFNIKNHIIMGEPHCVTLLSYQLSNFLTLDIILTSFGHFHIFWTF